MHISKNRKRTVANEKVDKAYSAEQRGTKVE